MTAPVDVRTYMAALPKDQRTALEKLRKVVKAAAPKTEEVISYSMPALRYRGYVLVWYAAWKNHCSLYPLPGAVKRADLKGYVISKGTIRFPNDKPIPATLVRKIVKARMKENELRTKKKGKLKK
jgi:uncharacterized protein YdhG (YjbR/CyaY superfamily)